MEQPDCTKRFYSPIWVSVIDQETGQIPECLYDNAVQYADDINRALHEFFSHPEHDIMTNFTLPGAPETEAALRAKVHAVRLSAKAIGSSLYAELTLELTGDLTGDELDCLLTQIKDQCRNGFGEDFELLDILTAQGDVVAARLGHDGLGFYPDQVPAPEQANLPVPEMNQGM